MNFISTKNANIRVNLSEAIQSGLANDGELFVPEQIPKIDLDKFTDDLSYPKFAAKLLHEFFKNDKLDDDLLGICNNTFTFPVPLEQLNHNTFLLELFHGPTSSFKDFGAGFLAECFSKISYNKTTTIMVATSGDTGSAVASAFYLKPHVNVIVLYPRGKISARQEHQIACWDNNILSLAVDGTFDDCQSLVKAAFQDPWWQNHIKLSSANSINIGRFLPKIVYYAYSSLQFYDRHKVMPGYIIPTGNLGNATAAYYAQMMGFPIREIVLATNANRVIQNYLQSGQYQACASITTLANAMDVGNPSNLERLRFIFQDFYTFKNKVSAFAVSDDDIKNTILNVYENNRIIVCPHTATACHVRNSLSDESWIIVATADPCKFDNVIEPIINTTIPMAEQLQNLLNKKIHTIEIDKSLDEIQKCLLNTWPDSI